MTSCVSDVTVSRFDLLCGETADGSGDVRVIREPYAIRLIHINKKRRFHLCFVACL